jgi:hypothetical protein
MIYEDFPSISLILVITLENRKTLFCVFLRFMNLPELKLTRDFSGINIYHDNHLEDKKSTRETMRAKQGQVAWASGQAMPPMPVWASSLRCCPSSSPGAQLDLKTYI